MRCLLVADKNCHWESVRSIDAEESASRRRRGVHLITVQHLVLGV